jgi:SAM-dependent methyltransferase
MALARHNRHVVAVDQRLEMAQAVRKLCVRSGVKNVDVLQGSLPKLGLRENSFDFIWCSLVLEYADRDAAMRLFSDLLRPGGRLYVSTNARGRWLVKAMSGMLRNDWNLVRVSARTALWGNAGGAVPNRLDLADVPTHVNAHGLRLVALGSEGYVHLGEGNAVPMPMSSCARSLRRNRQSTLTAESFAPTTIGRIGTHGSRVESRSER